MNSQTTTGPKGRISRVLLGLVLLFFAIYGSRRASATLIFVSVTIGLGMLIVYMLTHWLITRHADRSKPWLGALCGANGAVAFGVGGVLGLVTLLTLDTILLGWLGPGSVHWNLSMILGLGLAGAVGGGLLTNSWRGSLGFATAFGIAFLPVTPGMLLPIGVQGMTGQEGLGRLLGYFIMESSPAKFAIAGGLGTALAGIASQRAALRSGMVGAAGFGLGAVAGGSIGAFLLWSALPLDVFWMLAPSMGPFLIGGAVVGKHFGVNADARPPNPR